ncbi:MAG TPA: PAS domain-containing protein, partial [Verrucomicrobiae bacterium]|nr:PAS domain-containing protein [Verrucomicrobiae bacterium]
MGLDLPAAAERKGGDVDADQRVLFLEDELRRVNGELARVSGELERRVAERTQELMAAVRALQDEVAERRRTEEALRCSEERYALAVLGANDGIWDRDLITGEVYFSPRWKSMLGYLDHELDNHVEEWRRRIHPEDLERVTGHMESYLNACVPTYELEYRLRHRDGSYRWILTRGACFRDSTGRAYRVAGSHTDITARKTSEEALRRSEALLRVVLENLPVGVWIVDRTGHILLQNSAGVSILGGGAEALGALCSCRARWADTGKPLRPSDWGVARAVRFGETALNETLEIDAFDGRRKIVSVSAVPIG